MIRAARSLLAFGLAMMGGCTSSPSQSGGGFEGETVALSGLVTHAGSGIGGARVGFVDRATQECISRTVTDPDGTFHLGLPRFRPGFIETVSGDTILVRRLHETLPDSSIRLEAPSARLWRATLRWRQKPLGGAIVRPLGGTVSTISDSDGRILLLRNGRDRDWISVVLPDNSTRSIALGSLSDSVIDIPDQKRVLLDDFEVSAAQSAPGWVVGSGWWFANVDAPTGGSRILPESALSDLSLAYSTSDAHSGKSLMLQMQVNQGNPVHFAQIGVVLSDTGRGEWMDLSTMDSLTLWVKGTGTVRLAIATRTSLQPTQDPAGLWGVDLNLPGSWSRVVIRPGDFQAPAGSRPALAGIPWSTDSRKCRNLLISATASATLQLDDIEFHGVDLRALLVR